MIEMSEEFKEFLFELIDKQKEKLLSEDEVEVRIAKRYLKFINELLQKISVPVAEK